MHHILNQNHEDCLKPLICLTEISTSLLPKPRHKLSLNEKWRLYATLHWRLVVQDDRTNLVANDLIDPAHFERKRGDIAKALAESHKRHSDQLA